MNLHCCIVTGLSLVLCFVLFCANLQSHAALAMSSSCYESDESESEGAETFMANCVSWCKEKLLL